MTHLRFDVAKAMLATMLVDFAENDLDNLCRYLEHCGFDRRALDKPNDLLPDRPAWENILSAFASAENGSHPPCVRFFCSAANRTMGSVRALAAVGSNVGNEPPAPISATQAKVRKIRNAALARLMKST